MSEPTQNLDTNIWQPHGIPNPTLDGSIYFAQHYIAISAGVTEAMTLCPILISAPAGTTLGNEESRHFTHQTLGWRISTEPNAFGTGLIFTGARVGSSGPGAKNTSVPLWIPDSQSAYAPVQTIGDRFETTTSPHNHRQIPPHVLEVVLASETVKKATSGNISAIAVTEQTIQNGSPVLPFMGPQGVRLFVHSLVQDDAMNIVAIVVPDVESQKIGSEGLDVKGSHKIMIAMALLNAHMLRYSHVFGDFLIKSVTPPNYGDKNTVAALSGNTSGSEESGKKGFYAVNVKLKRKQPNS